MDRGMYAAASGGMINLRKLELVANNLANINTVGFKRQRLSSEQQEFGDTLASQLENVSQRAQGDQQRVPAAVDVASITDFRPGPVQITGNSLHVALTKDDEFFAVQTPEGEAYTRAGNFTLNALGNIVTHDGLPVLGDGGLITVPPEATPSITGSGAIVADDEVIGRLRVVKIDDFTQLERTEGVRFRLRDGQGAAIEQPELAAGAVEMPNVNAVQAMIELVSAHRSFEAYQKIAREIDTLNTAAIRSGSSR